MKPERIFFLTAVVLIVLSVISPIMTTVVASGYVDISVSEANVMIQTDPSLVLLDVRNQSEYDTGHIRNAKLTPVWQLTARLNELNISDRILVYCKMGGRSANASKILTDNGFTHVYNMLGGITDWMGQDYPVYVKYASIQEAINNATDGDTIRVSTGLYNEIVSLNKSITLLGEDAVTTTINATETTLHVSTDNVSISDFTIMYSGCACYGYSALNITNSQNVNVTSTIIASDDFGIYVAATRRIVIAQSNVTQTGDASIVVSESSQISVLQNHVRASDGIEVENTSASKFSDNTIFSEHGAGIFTSASYNNTFSNNNVSSPSSTCISISTSYANTFFGNSFFSNGPYGLFFWQSNNNSFCHNNFEGKACLTANYESTNFWNNSFEGNFWSNYTGVDINLNGIGDTPYILDSTDKDKYPLMGPFRSFRISSETDVDIVSNSTISELQYLGTNGTIRLQVSNMTANQTTGFCRVSIPHSLIDPNNGPISVIIDNGQTPILFLNYTLFDNGTHRWIYFVYPHSTHDVAIVPEFPTFLDLPLFMIAIVMATIAHKAKKHKNVDEA